MKRFALFLIVLLAIIGAVGWAVSKDPGYVLISYDRFRYESSLWVLIGLILVVWLLVVLVHRILGVLQLSGALVNPWSRRHRERRIDRKSVV